MSASRRDSRVAVRSSEAHAVMEVHLDAERCMTVSTVLVVDDDPGIRESLGDVLRAEGYQVRLAENGLIGLRDMRSTPRPDVVILDLMMPILSGWEVLEEISEDAALRPIPVLVVSAMSAPVDPACMQ